MLLGTPWLSSDLVAPAINFAFALGTDPSSRKAGSAVFPAEFREGKAATRAGSSGHEQSQYQHSQSTQSASNSSKKHSGLPRFHDVSPQGKNRLTGTTEISAQRHGRDAGLIGSWYALTPLIFIFRLNTLSPQVANSVSKSLPPKQRLEILPFGVGMMQFTRPAWSHT